MKHVIYFAKRVHSFAGPILYLNLAGMIMISLFEGVGIFLLIPLISLAGVLNVPPGQASLFSWIQKMFHGLPGEMSLPLILAIYVVLIVGQSYFQRSQTILNAKIQQGYMRHLREETYKDLVQANWGFFLKTRKSDIINVMTTEISRVNTGTQMFLQFIASLVFTFIQIGLAFFLSPILTVSVLVFGSALLFFSRKFVRRSSSIGEETTQLAKMYLAGISDHFNGIKDIKSNTLEDTHLAWFRTLGLKLERNVMAVMRVNTASQFVFKIISALLMAGFVYVAIQMFQAQPAQLMLIMVIFSRLWPRFSTIQSNLEQLGGVIPSFKHLIELQNECRKARELHDRNEWSAAPIRIREGIECRDVCFRYSPNQSAYTLQNINLYIPANQMTAIVGRSGAGKSTLIDLLLGLNQPEAGQVLIDGVPLTQDMLLPVRRSMSYVPQDPFLFNASVRDNLLMMEPDASEERMWEALQFSSAAEFVGKLPQGLDTLIGDRGVRLSGGERQRLVLARAILRKPSVLILDEATSALDTENEAKIQQALDNLKGTMTIIVIAHRLSTVRNADQVIVLDQGRMVQRGGFNQLARERDGLFSKFLGNQTVEPDSKVLYKV